MAGNATAPQQAAPDAWTRRIGRRTLIGAAAGLALVMALDGTALASARGERRLVLYNPHTDDRFSDTYWADGQYLDASLKHINWLMRDFHSGEVKPIDPELLDLLHRIGSRLDNGRPFEILSGFRTIATNRLLRREGLAPAAHSEHLQAKAADIRIQGVRLKHLRKAALSLKAGGVGTYWHDEFVHVDVGPVRSWRG